MSRIYIRDFFLILYFATSYVEAISKKLLLGILVNYELQYDPPYRFF